jgi:tetratricopeptide (TPR) repeat protein
VDLEHAVRLYPHFGDALNNLALVMHEIGEPAAALPLYSRALALEGEAVTLNNRALCLNELGRHQEAVRDFSFILKWLSPRNVDAFNNRAFAYNSMGCHELAVADCEAALARKPHLAEPRRICAFAYFKLGRFEQAILEATHAIELFDGVYDKAYYTRGLALRAMAETMPQEAVARRELEAKADEDIRVAIEKCPNVAEDL